MALYRFEAPVIPELVSVMSDSCGQDACAEFVEGVFFFSLEGSPDHD